MSCLEEVETSQIAKASKKAWKRLFSNLTYCVVSHKFPALLVPLFSKNSSFPRTPWRSLYIYKWICRELTMLNRLSTYLYFSTFDLKISSFQRDIYFFSFKYLLTFIIYPRSTLNNRDFPLLNSLLLIMKNKFHSYSIF